jgi:hypothetical protein
MAWLEGLEDLEDCVVLAACLGYTVGVGASIRMGSSTILRLACGRLPVNITSSSLDPETTGDGERITGAGRCLVAGL